MPKPSYPFADYLMSGLKWKIEECCNFRIHNKADCDKLAVFVANKTQQSVSANTLYRLFLHPNNTNKPYLHTLNTLVQFIDFANWDAFCSYYQDLYSFQFLSGIIPPTHSFNSLLRICIYQNEFNSVYTFFDQFSSDLSIDKKHLLGDELFNTLRQNPVSNVPFFRKLHSLPIVRECLFELLADPDFRIPQYEFGLKCYLQNVSPEKTSKDLQDYIFAHSLLFRHYFYKKQYKKAFEHGKHLYGLHHYSAQELKDVHLFPRFRYLCYYILFRHDKVGFDQSYWDWFYPYLNSILGEANFEERRIVIHTCYETLGLYPSKQREVLEDFMQLYPENFQHFHHDWNDLSQFKILKLLDPNASTFFEGQRIYQP